MILLDAPEPRKSRGVNDFKYPRFPTFPRDVVRIPLRGIVQKLLQKIPQKSTICVTKKKQRFLYVHFESANLRCYY